MKPKHNILSLLGAVIGGVLGHFIFAWVVRQGFYGLIIPGVAVGLGAGCFKAPSKWVTVLCGLWALALSLFTEWRFFPFQKDDSLGYFLSNIHDLKPVTLIMIAVGSFIAFWIPFSNIRKQKSNDHTQ